MRIYTLILIVITYFNNSNSLICAQEKQLRVNYKFERKNLYLDDNDKILIMARPVHYLNVYNYGNISIRETDPMVGVSDTTYKYIKIAYNKGMLVEPVIKQRGEYSMLLKEPLQLFDWKLEKPTKTILGYYCNKATCTFRGRAYIAYFTREIPYKAAPWKFHGLPGVVLEVHSSDDFLRWTAQSINIETKTEKIELEHYGMNVINLEEYFDVLKNREQVLIETLRKNKLRIPGNRSDKDIKQVKLPNSIEIFDWISE
ncbi:GLPGLI family protein [Marinifilum sp.]|uniref:GLPGLI family protein n=1 Tax=Marinifilum sp. TaxID=2033137 RepID=UPI003BAB90BA